LTADLPAENADEQPTLAPQLNYDDVNVHTSSEYDIYGRG